MAVALIAFVAAPFASAEEISPAPDSYSFGSTSEFSPYSTISIGTNGGGGLAPTGQNAWLLYVIAVIAIISPLAYFGIKKFKK